MGPECKWDGDRKEARQAMRCMRRTGPVWNRQTYEGGDPSGRHTPANPCLGAGSGSIETDRSQRPVVGRRKTAPPLEQVPGVVQETLRAMVHESMHADPPTALSPFLSP